MDQPSAYAITWGPEDEPRCPCAMTESTEPARCFISSTDPRFCACEACGTRYRTPVHWLLGVLLRTAIKRGWGDALIVAMVPDPPPTTGG